MNTEAIGKNIRSRMLKEGILQNRLAQRTGLTDVTLSRYVNGKRQPTVYALYRISWALGCTMDDLVEGIDKE